MCAIIGACIKNPSQSDLIILSNVFRESSIRGLHATGISWIRGGQIHTHIDPKPASVVMDYFDLGSCVNEDGNLYLIGHCRYSTSDLEYNQPLYNRNLSIVHNGVISQELPENWKSMYGYDTKTKNDSELLLHTIEAGKEPFEVWPNSSIAAIELHTDKKLVYYRNGKRPIYHSVLENGVIVTSTKDIMTRATKGAIAAIPLEKDLKISYNSGRFEHKMVYTKSVDLQNV